MNGPLPQILCVDDEPLNLSLLEAMLTPRGYDVVTAINGLQAVEKVKNGQIDICLLDVMMPGMDGFEVCQWLKSDATYNSIPVILITTLSDRESRIKGIDAGAEDFISKPFDAAEVLARIKMLLHVKSLTDELKHISLVAETANRAKSEFLSRMSHELRSPLNAILGFAQLMESDVPSLASSQKESVAQILTAGWHLLTLINDILDLAKVESGKITLVREPVALAEVLDECRDIVALQAEHHDIALQFPPFDTSSVVIADRTRVKQVLINLLTNAIKYNSKPGTVAVTCRVTTPERIRVSIRDTGAGLQPEQQEQLFQPFNRLGQENGSEEGTGIGLVVTKQLVELMGGSIGMASSVGVGSEFWVELIRDTHPQLLPECSGVATDTRTPQTCQEQVHTLLYIEDNPSNLALITQLLLRHPTISLITAITGNSGIEAACASRPDVILTDLNLPDISGYDVLKALQADKATAHIPVIAISANAMPFDIERGLNAGFFRYITKPIKLHEFLDALHVTLDFADTGVQPKPLRMYP